MSLHEIIQSYCKQITFNLPEQNGLVQQASRHIILFNSGENDFVGDSITIRETTKYSIENSGTKKQDTDDSVKINATTYCKLPYFNKNSEGEYVGPPDIKPNKNNLTKIAHENDFDGLILKYANEYGIEAAFLKAFIRKESRFNVNAKNKNSTASGLMQMLHQTRKAYNVTNPFNAEQSIKGGAKMLSDLLEQFDGDKKKAALGYYQGAAGARKILRSGKDDKDGYASDIMQFYTEYTISLAT